MDPYRGETQFETGDINGDGLAYTDADAVVFSSYFASRQNRYGFDDLGEFQESASDVNHDLIYAGVADLVFLIRVVVENARPSDKVTTISANLTVGTSMSVDAPMGAAYVVLEGDRTPVLESPNMEMWSYFEGENTHVLVWSLDGESFVGEFLGNVGTVVSVELGSAEGAPVVIKQSPYHLRHRVTIPLTRNQSPTQHR